MVGDVDVRTETAIHRPVEDVAASCVGEDARAGVVREHPERRLTYAVAGGCRQPHGFRRASWASGWPTPYEVTELEPGRKQAHADGPFSPGVNRSTIRLDALWLW